MEPGSGQIPEPAFEVAETPRQRWRLVLARDAGPAGLTGRDLNAAWEAALDTCGLPVHRPIGRGRSRIALGAPVPASMALEHELADVVLTEFCPTWIVREALVGRLPQGWQLVDLHDVWLGEPALAGQVAAADYRIELGEADADAVARAANTILASSRLPRERVKGGTTVAYDLRPLLVNVSVADPGRPLVVRVRTRFDPALGTGRPEEVVAALGDAAGVGLTIGRVVRERLILADELEG